MTSVSLLCTQIQESCSAWLERIAVAKGEVTLEVKPENLHPLCLVLRDHPSFDFKLLVDICGVDYLHYGLSEWETHSATESGFSRGVEQSFPYQVEEKKSARFAVVYHLLSLTHNHRVRLRQFLPEEHLMADSVMDIWPAANWYEREAFDLFGILFKGHPDLRRILTDYGFVGHPFRKDFPLIGKVEARYDAEQKRVIYEPVSIEPRILEPKVIRRDNRYVTESGEQQ